MNATVVGTRPAASVFTNSGGRRRHSQSGAEPAVRTLVECAVDDPDRDSVIGTPEREVRAFRSFFAGFHEDPAALLETTFEKTAAYDEMFVFHGIRLESHCEHGIVPTKDKAHTGYLPADCVVGIVKLARLVELFGNRMEIQEALTSQLADSILDAQEPRGVGVVIEAAQQCMTSRGTRMPGVNMVTSRMLGLLRDDRTTRREFLSMIGSRRRTPHAC